MQIMICLTFPFLAMKFFPRPHIFLTKIDRSVLSIFVKKMKRISDKALVGIVRRKQGKLSGILLKICPAFPEKEGTNVRGLFLSRERLSASHPALAIKTPRALRKSSSQANEPAVPHSCGYAVFSVFASLLDFTLSGYSLWACSFSRSSKAVSKTARWNGINASLSCSTLSCGAKKAEAFSKAIA